MLLSGRFERQPFGPERVADLLNADTGFFPVGLNSLSAPDAVISTRSQFAAERRSRPRSTGGYSVATEREVRILVSNGRTVEGRVSVYRPTGRDRISDCPRGGTLPAYRDSGRQIIVNADHVVQLRTTTEACTTTASTGDRVTGQFPADRRSQIPSRCPSRPTGVISQTLCRNAKAIDKMG